MSNMTRTVYSFTIAPRHFRAIDRIFDAALSHPDQKDEVLATIAATMIAAVEVLMPALGGPEAVEKTLENLIGNAIETVIRETPGGIR